MGAVIAQVSPHVGQMHLSSFIWPLQCGCQKTQHVSFNAMMQSKLIEAP